MRTICSNLWAGVFFLETCRCKFILKTTAGSDSAYRGQLDSGPPLSQRLLGGWIRDEDFRSHMDLTFKLVSCPLLSGALRAALSRRCAVPTSVFDFACKLFSPFMRFHPVFPRFCVMLSVRGGWEKDNEMKEEENMRKHLRSSKDKSVRKWMPQLSGRLLWDVSPEHLLSDVTVTQWKVQGVSIRAAHAIHSITVAYHLAFTVGPHNWQSCPQLE